MGFQATPDVTGDLDWSTRPGATLQMTTRNVRTAARTQIRHHTLPLARTRATPPKDNLLHGRAQHNATARAQPLHRPSSFRTTHSAHPLSAVPVDAAQPAHQPPAAAATSLIAACAIARIFYSSWGPGPVVDCSIFAT